MFRSTLSRVAARLGGSRVGARNGKTADRAHGGRQTLVGTVLLTVGKLLAVYVAAICVMVAALVAANSIPNERIGRHVYESIPSVGFERTLLSWGAFDLFTECVAVTAGLTVTNEPTTALSRALLSPTLFSCEQAKEAFKTGKGGFNYWRYWHGYAVISRPILFLVDIPALRTITAIAFLAACLSFCAVLLRNVGEVYAAFVLFSLLFTQSYSHLVLISHSLVWIIGFGVGAWLLHLTDRNNQAFDKHYLPLFFLIGMVTSYVDFLTAPLVTLTLPLLALYLADRWPSTKPGRTLTMAVALMAGVWALGYVACWMTKWALAAQVLGDGWADVLAVVEYRMSGTIEGEPTTALHSLQKNLYEMRFGVAALAIFTCGRLALRWRSLHNPFSSFDQGVAAALIFLLPLAWMVVVKNHSVVHAWFVSPILVPSGILLLSLIWRATDNKGPNDAQVAQP